MAAPPLAIGDETLSLRTKLDEAWPETRYRCFWAHSAWTEKEFDRFVDKIADKYPEPADMFLVRLKFLLTLTAEMSQYNLQRAIVY